MSGIDKTELAGSRKQSLFALLLGALEAGLGLCVLVTPRALHMDAQSDSHTCPGDGECQWCVQRVLQPLLGFLVICVENYTQVSYLPPGQQ